MGTITKHATIEGKTLKEAFKKLQDEDRKDKGTDIYSGGWNNCQGVREVSTSEFTARLKENNISKHEPAIAKCLQKPIINKNTIKTQVLNFPNKGSRKWITVYVAEDINGNVIIEEESQSNAIKKAREYVEKNSSVKLNVYISKKLVNNATKVATIVYKPSKNESNGRWQIYGAMSY